MLPLMAHTLRKQTSRFRVARGLPAVKPDTHPSPRSLRRRKLRRQSSAQYHNKKYGDTEVCEKRMRLVSGHYINVWVSARYHGIQMSKVNKQNSTHRTDHYIDHLNHLDHLNHVDHVSCTGHFFPAVVRCCARSICKEPGSNPKNMC